MYMISDGTSEDYIFEFFSKWNILILICCLWIIILCWNILQPMPADGIHIKEKHYNIDEKRFEEICDDLCNIYEAETSDLIKNELNRFLDVEGWVEKVGHNLNYPTPFKPRSHLKRKRKGELYDRPDIDELASILQRYGDKHNDALKPHVGRLIASTNYSSFKAAFNEAIHSDLNSHKEPWRNVALTIELASLALKSVRSCKEPLQNILRKTNRYVEDNYSNNQLSWIIPGIFKHSIWKYSNSVGCESLLEDVGITIIDKNYSDSE